MPDVVTVDQIRDLIKSENIRPSDIFPVDKLVADPAVKGYADDRVRERIGSEYQHRKSAEEELEKFRKEAGPKEAALQAEIKALKATAAKARVGSLLDKQKEARKLDDRQLKFIQNRLTRFEPKDPDKLEEEFNAHLDAEVDEYGMLEKVFGPAPDKPGEDDGGKVDPLTGPNKNKPAGDALPKHLDPKHNPFIRTD